MVHTASCNNRSPCSSEKPVISIPEKLAPGKFFVKHGFHAGHVDMSILVTLQPHAITLGPGIKYLILICYHYSL
jgi:hypothetical protein